MNKNDFLLAVHEYLKALGYRKNKSYWFLSNGELVYCVYVIIPREIAQHDRSN